MEAALEMWEAAKLATARSGAPYTNPALADVPALAEDMATVAGAAHKVKTAARKARQRTRPAAGGP
jgi:hypothetical protein